ncbi:MAG: leucine-rich repeat protein [Ruminococcus sp.]|nr:leucine-rich repeat protein [Ruminococcus sp.]
MAKQNYIKRVLAGTFALVMVAGYLPGKINKDGSICITASAETQSGVIDDINWVFTDDGTLTLSPTEETAEIPRNFCSDYLDRKFSGKVTKVVFKDGIKAIGGFSFDMLSYLTEADFSECTTLESIDDGAFDGTNISTFDFSACTSLKTLNYGSLASSNLSEVRLGISNPEDIVINESAFNPENIGINDVKIVVPIGSANTWVNYYKNQGKEPDGNKFSNLFGTKSVTFKSDPLTGTYEGVKWELTDDGTLTLSGNSIGYEFCKGLPFDDATKNSIKKVVYTNSVEIINYDSLYGIMGVEEFDFSNCTNLERLEKHSICSQKKLTSIDLSACKKLKYIGSSFISNSKVSKISLGISDPSKITIADDALSTLLADVDNVTISVPVGSADDWVKYYTEKGNTPEGNTFSGLFGANSVTFTEPEYEINGNVLTISGTVDMVDERFVRNIPGIENVTKVVFKDGITEIFLFAFEGMSNITEADFSECTTLRGISDYAFAGTKISTFDLSACSKLEYIHHSPFYSDYLSEIRLGISDPSKIYFDRVPFGGNDITIVVPYGSADTWVNYYKSSADLLVDNTLIGLFDAKSVTFKDAAADVNTLTPDSLINLSIISPEAELKIVLDGNEVGTIDASTAYTANNLVFRKIENGKVYLQTPVDINNLKAGDVIEADTALFKNGDDFTVNFDDSDKDAANIFIVPQKATYVKTSDGKIYLESVYNSVLALINLGEYAVTDNNGNILTPNDGKYTLTNKKSYYIYTDKSIADSVTTEELGISLQSNKTYNNKTYKYRYTINVPFEPSESYILSHNNNWRGVVKASEKGKLYIGEDNDFSILGAYIKGNDTYYYGDVVPDDAITITDGLEMDEDKKAGIISVTDVYFAEEEGAIVDTPEVGKNYFLAADVTVDNSAVLEDPNIDAQVFYIEQPISYEKRPLTMCDIYLKNGEELIPLEVKDGAVTIPEKTFTYNANEQKPVIVIKNNVYGTETVLTADEYTDTLEAKTDVGTYSAEFTTKDDCKFYTGSLTVNWSIEKGNADIKVAPVENIVYDGSEIDITDFIFTGNDAALVNDTETYPETEVTISSNSSKKLINELTNAGKHNATIILKFKNYNELELPVEFEIKKRELKITPKEDQKIVYGTLEKPILTFDLETAADEDENNEWDTKTGVIPSDIEKIDFSPALALRDFDYNHFVNDAGTYKYGITTEEFDNYTAVLDGDAVFTIEPKELSADMFIVDDEDYTYDATKKKAPDFTLDDGTFLDTPHTPKLTSNDFIQGGTDHAVLPGTYTVEFFGQGNYKGLVTYDWQIKPILTYSIYASLPESKVYDGKADEPEVFIYKTADTSKTPFDGIKDLKYTYTYYSVDEEGHMTKLDGAPKDAGQYRLAVSAAAKVYSFNTVYVDYEITQKEIAITPNAPENKIFGAADPDWADYSYDEDEFIEGETPEITGEYGLADYEANVGEYDFTLGTIEIDDSNYYLSIDGTFTVLPQELTDENIIVISDCRFKDDGWSYPGDCIKVIGIVNGEEVELERPVYDEATGEYNGTDFLFVSATKTKRDGNFSVQVEGIGNYTGFAEAIVVVDNASFNVTVKNGTFADKSTSASFKAGEIAAVTADAPEAGYKFGYWRRNGQTISYNNKYTFYVPTDDVELEAVYVEDTDDIERYGNAAIESVDIDKENQKMKFVSLLNVPEDCKILKAGVVATADEAKAKDLTIDNSDYTTLYKTNITAHNYRYTLTIQNDQALKTWYVKGYLEYEDANGNVKTVYSDLTKADLEGYETIHEDKIVGTAVMESIEDDSVNKVFKFVTMTSVPADCTILKSGVVATSNYDDSKNLTIDNSEYKTLYNTNITAHNFRYTLSIKNAMYEKSWYVRPYLVYKDSSGKEFTVYGDVASNVTVK